MRMLAEVGLAQLALYAVFLGPPFVVYWVFTAGEHFFGWLGGIGFVAAAVVCIAIVFDALQKKQKDQPHE